MYIKQIFAKKLPPRLVRFDVELLLMAVLGCQRSFLYANVDYELTSGEQEKFDFFYNRRCQGEPAAYILGKKEFWSLEFTVNSKVLIPRPETELLVEIALAKVNSDEARIADLGTGSGAIALSLAREHPRWSLMATDISVDALQIASHNAMQLGVTNVEFHHGYWCQALGEEKFSAIISNPPYVARDDHHWQHKELHFEPKLALVAGDGLDAFREIVAGASSHLQVGGWLILEHGYDQRRTVVSLLELAGYQEITTYTDFADNERAVAARIF